MSLQLVNERRERVYVILAGFFLSAMTLLNVVGLTKFIQIGPLSVAVGVLPYPLTFLCTDLISEIYGRRRANFLVWIGFLLNVFVILMLWIGQNLPSVPIDKMPPWQILPLNPEVSVYLPNGAQVTGNVELFYFIYSTTAGAVFASMVAYLLAQLCDVHVFHKIKKLTKGKMLWLRNNISTLTSQLVDSFAVVSITFGMAFYRGELEFAALLTLFLSNYFFKAIAALVDTPIIYAAMSFLTKYLKLNEHPIQQD